MIRSAIAPLIFGSVMITGLALYLVIYHPAPGPLAAGHDAIEGLSVLSGCIRCHTPEGLVAGCLACHEEIRKQLASHAGFHAYLASRNPDTKCQTCHPDHNGASVDLLGTVAWRGEAEESFHHEHTAFHLTGRHGDIECAACHQAEGREPFTLPSFPSIPRRRSFLGLTQTCKDCHEDVHAGGLSPDCETCHGQEHFAPADHFDHSRFFALENGHDGVECAGCHLIPERHGETKEGVEAKADVLPFDKVRGTACRECHDSPHRAAWNGDCAACHPEDASPWTVAVTSISPAIHALTGFLLVKPHEKVACDACHPPELAFEERYPDPAAPGYRRRQHSCEGCHRDAHDGQFAGRHERCIDCHATTHFMPPEFGIEDHEVFPLTGAHATVLCQLCHPSRQVLEPGPTGPTARRVRAFIGVSRECKGCHRDPHGGQFARELREGDCTSCHAASCETFFITPFDHAEKTGYELTGAHARASCQDCHTLDEEPGSSGGGGSGDTLAFRIYRGIPRACVACHDDVHLGQFRDERDGTIRCERCHTSNESWKTIEFDHNRDSRFALDGVHEKLECSACHPAVEVPATDVPWAGDRKTVEVVQYRPLGRTCEDCHGFIPR